MNADVPVSAWDVLLKLDRKFLDGGKLRGNLLCGAGRCCGKRCHLSLSVSSHRGSAQSIKHGLNKNVEAFQFGTICLPVPLQPAPLAPRERRNVRGESSGGC